LGRSEYSPDQYWEYPLANILLFCLAILLRFLARLAAFMWFVLVVGVEVRGFNKTLVVGLS